MKMRWVLEGLGKAGERAGKLELGSALLPTPGPLLVTQGGLLPHLTQETLAHLPWARSAPVVAPLQHHLKQGPVLEQWGRGLAAFCGLGDHPLLLSLHDTMEELRSGYNRNKSVSIWQFGTNQVHVDPGQYMEVVRQARPAAFLALCDGDTKSDCSNKRISHSVAKSLLFLDSCLETVATDPALEGIGVIAAVEVRCRACNLKFKIAGRPRAEGEEEVCPRGSYPGSGGLPAGRLPPPRGGGRGAGV